MSLIIKDKIKQLMRGYPTVSDKYNVEGGIIEGTNGVNFGDMVVYGSKTGYYKKRQHLRVSTNLRALCWRPTSSSKILGAEKTKVPSLIRAKHSTCS